jgi:hypothetical protein
MYNKAKVTTNSKTFGAKVFFGRQAEDVERHTRDILFELRELEGVSDLVFAAQKLAGDVLINESNQFFLRINNNPIVHTVTNLGTGGLYIQPPLAEDQKKFSPLVRIMGNGIFYGGIHSIQVNGENMPTNSTHVLVESKNFTVSA